MSGLCVERMRSVREAAEKEARFHRHRHRHRHNLGGICQVGVV